MKIASSPLVRRVDIKRVSNSECERTFDLVAVEEPLEIRLAHWQKGSYRTESLALTMRTPGHDRHLALGFLYAEGVISRPEDVRDLRSLGGDESNELLVEISREVDVETWRMSRAGFVSSSCGICGKRSVESLASRSLISGGDDFTVTSKFIHRLPALLSEGQTAFSQTGGLHAAALIDADGVLQAAFEDIGRHNALDKLIGWAFENNHLPLERQILFLSSRSSFELVQKAAAAGAPLLATVGSSSSLAIETARRYGLTLLGFVRSERYNVYSGDWRIHS